MRHKVAPFGLVLTLTVSGCGILDPFDGGSCGDRDAQGCAIVDVFVEAPPKPWPARYRWSVQAVPARAESGADIAGDYESGPGWQRLRIRRWWRPPSEQGDTVSMWIAARILDDTGPVQVGVPLPSYAADSSLIVVRFVPPEVEPRPVKVRLRMEVK